MKKTKTNKTKSTKPKVRSAKKYPSHYLALALVSTLLIEGVLFGSARASDWNTGLPATTGGTIEAGAQLLDVSTGVREATADIISVFQPEVDTMQGVSNFYWQATNEMMKFLDISSSNPGLEVAYIYNGVGDFYQQASNQIVQLLDVPK